MRTRPLVLLTALLSLLAATFVGTTAPASAATADRWGFAYVQDPTVPVWTTLDTTRQWGSWKAAAPFAWANGIKIAPGRFLVRFPGIGTGSRGVVHVTPVNRTGHYCEAVRWYQSGADQIVDVQCHKPGGGWDDSPFTVLWTLSSGVLPVGLGSHAYLQYGAGGLAQAYNSTGGGVGVTPGGAGQYQVKLGGVGLAGVLAGNVQVTAVQPNAQARRCKVYHWFASGPDVIVHVFCHDLTGTPVNSEFTLSYHRQRAVFGDFGPPKYFGYLATAAGGPTNYNHPVGVGANSFGPLAPTGRYLVKYPQLGQKETHAQVTAQGGGPYYCNLTAPWTFAGMDAQVDVLCFDNAGVPTPHGFLSTFSSRI
ncbi:hypothetical protein V6U90_27085 [Micromonospora sp. CPCC 206060]|uniref:hypothetical protein n=1 Tax=Micromonospora sp. CPCC 206060 TaxID=3122406 RepID=UPI002FF1F1CC